MTRIFPRFSSLLAVVSLAALPLVVTVVGCGSDDDVKTDGAPASDPGQTDATPGATDAAAGGGSFLSSSAVSVVFVDQVEVTDYTQDTTVTLDLATGALTLHASSLGTSPFADAGALIDSGLGSDGGGPSTLDGSRTLTAAQLAQLTVAIDAITLTSAACTTTTEESLQLTVEGASGTFAYSDYAYCSAPTARVAGAHAAYEVALSFLSAP